MPDRLTELERQRALVQEHLAWLDREIAATKDPAKTVPAPLAHLPSPAAQPSIPGHTRPDPVAAEIAAEEIIARYKQEKQSLHGTVKRGCFLYFFAALALLGLGVLALYFLRSRA